MSEQGPLTVRVQVRYAQPIVYAMRLVASEAVYLREGEKKSLVNGAIVDARIVYDEEIPPLFNTSPPTPEEIARGQALALAEKKAMREMSASELRAVYLHMTQAMVMLDATGGVKDERLADGLRDLMDHVWYRLYDASKESA